MRIKFEFSSEKRTQPSLFHYIKEEQEQSVWEDMDWGFLRHPIRTFKQAWKEPRTKPSLFHYTEQEQKATHKTYVHGRLQILSWRDEGGGTERPRREKVEVGYASA